MKFISSDKVYNPIGPFSQAVVVGNTAYLSGIGGLEMDGKAASLDVEQQTKKAIENCKAILEAAGFTFKDVVKSCVYLTDMNDYAKVNAIYAEYMGDHRPARICMTVKDLPANEVMKLDMIAVKE